MGSQEKAESIALCKERVRMLSHKCLELKKMYLVSQSDSCGKARIVYEML